MTIQIHLGKVELDIEFWYNISVIKKGKDSMEKVRLVIDLDELNEETKRELLDVLYHVEDQMCYKCKSVSKTIDYLQNILFEEKSDMYMQVEFATKNKREIIRRQIISMPNIKSKTLTNQEIDFCENKANSLCKNSERVLGWKILEQYELYKEEVK